MYAKCPKLRDVAIFLFGLVAAVIAAHPLYDPDLGWHLAGGYWMLKHRALPLFDPFGSEGNLWINYSWVFELVVAVTHQFGSWTALVVMQVVGAAAVVCFVIKHSTDFANKNLGEKAHPRLFLAAAVCSGLVYAGLSPFLYLRPQLFSLLLWAALLFRAAADFLPHSIPRYRQWFILTAIWANIHVYWILAPMLFACGLIVKFAAQAGNKRRFLLSQTRSVLWLCCLCAAGLFTPFGKHYYEALWALVRNHSIAYTVVREFQPLDSEFGFPFYIYLATIGLVLFWLPSNLRRLKEPAIQILSFWSAVFALAGLSQVKYLPLYFVTVSPLLFTSAYSLVQRFCPSREFASAQPRGQLHSKPILAVGALSGALLTILLISSIRVPPMLDTKWSELCQAVEQSDAGFPGGNILNHFDDGGWLAFCLASRLGWPRKMTHKTTIDGRTLVMGEERLAQFQKLNSQPADCSVPSHWETSTAVVRKNSKLSQALVEDCGWREQQTLYGISVLQAHFDQVR